MPTTQDHYLGLSPAVPEMRNGEITSRSETGVGEDAGNVHGRFGTVAGGQAGLRSFHGIKMTRTNRANWEIGHRDWHC